MGIVTLPNDSNTGSLRDGTDEARGSYVYQNDKALADEINGNLEDANIKTGAGIAWSKVNKSGSNLTDISTKSHTSLTDIGVNTHAQIDGSITTTNGHIAATEAHGATGAVVGTTNEQSLSSKTMYGPFKLSRAVAAADADIAAANVYIGVTDTSAARTITILTAAIVEGAVWVVKDESGAAGVNNITIATQGAETLEGFDSIVINSPGGAFILMATSASTIAIIGAY